MCNPYEKEYNIEYEKRFLDFFGYKLFKLENHPKWIIFDNKNDCIGYIQINDHINEDECEIKTNGVVSFYNKRLYSDESKLDNIYIFTIKDFNGHSSQIKITLGSHNSIVLISDIYGDILFDFSNEGLLLDCKYETDKLLVNEIVRFNSSQEKFDIKEYSYKVRYCDKKAGETAQITTLSIDGKYNPYYMSPNIIDVSEGTLINDTFLHSQKSRVEGTVEEMAVKHEMGIDTFNYFRKKVNEAIPFRDDIFKLLLTEKMIDQKLIGIFAPDLAGEKTTTDYYKRIRK